MKTQDELTRHLQCEKVAELAEATGINPQSIREWRNYGKPMSKPVHAMWHYYFTAKELESDLRTLRKYLP